MNWLVKRIWLDTIIMAKFKQKSITLTKLLT